MVGNSVLSTIILNWNRSGLLRQTVESYTRTVTGRFELFVVDNASTDDSREFLRRVEADGLAKVLYLSENIGGLAFNEAIPLTTGDLIHLSENDQIFLPGWFEHVTSSFTAFPDLGQLSLFSGVATDEEAHGDSAPSDLRFAKGKILYAARGNLTTSSVLRASLLREGGIRLTNIERGNFKFPDDGKLSADVKAAGYWCAYSDRYYVRNLGHEVTEFEANPDYYQENYASKPWVGVAGWQERVARQKSRPKINRFSSVFSGRPALPEKTPGDVGGKPARL
ncbi:MAG: glycosyltransferase family 2 protein, partial [Terriglobia bacterium]